MRKVTAGVVSLVLASGAGAAFGIAPATAVSTDTANSSPQASKQTSDELPNVLETKRRDLREAAIAKVMKGKAKPFKRGGSTVVKVGHEAGAKSAGASLKAATPAEEQYVELSREKTDKIFVILTEFGNERHPDYPDQDTDPTTPGPTTFEGPLRNKIPEPNRATDNATNWQPNYDQRYYQDLYFGTGESSVASFYNKQSSGRYTVDGEVSDWVKVKYNEARYGRSNGKFPCPSNNCSNVWNLVQDAVNQWVVDQKAAGRTQEQIVTDLKSYDQWDRYDYDHDGDFNEPDGYLDHFQIVHAGGDQADGDPIQGEDAIWSHRWYAFYGNKTGPAQNKLGGAQIADTGLWVGDYTVQPENGGLGVFAHEYGHDLGLPDLYDTAGGSNGVEHWSLMAQSRLGAKGEPLGTRPGDFGAWEKIQLGWFDYEVVPAGKSKTLNLGPHEYNSAKPQGVVIPLPDKQVVTQLGAPASGVSQWFSGQGDDLNNTLTRTVALKDGTSTLSFKARWNMEDGYDYAFVEVNAGSGWVSVPGSVTQPTADNGWDGLQATYVPATFDLSSYAGKTVQLRLRYQTDGAAQGSDSTLGWSGLMTDDLSLTSGGTTVFADDAEAADPAWTAVGFSRVGSSVTKGYPNYYVASNRTYVSYDRWLQTGPYNFMGPKNPRMVEHFPYQQGLLVTYWDTSQNDNNTKTHPGSGLALPIDAHPEALYRLDGNPWRGRVQVYDAPFSLKKADSLSLHFNDRASYVRGQNAAPTFDDRKSYYDTATPLVGVKVPNAGVKVQVTKQNGTSMTIKISSTKK